MAFLCVVKFDFTLICFVVCRATETQGMIDLTTNPLSEYEKENVKVHNSGNI
jgi:hypothetical protein